MVNKGKESPRKHENKKREAFHEVIRMDRNQPRSPISNQSWRFYNPGDDSEANTRRNREFSNEQKDPIPSIDRGIYNDSQHEDQLLTLRAELERLKEDKASREVEMEITKREMVSIKSSLARNQKFLMELKDEMLDAKTKKFSKRSMNMKNLL